MKTVDYIVTYTIGKYSGEVPVKALEDAQYDEIVRRAKRKVYRERAIPIEGSQKWSVRRAWFI